MIRSVVPSFDAARWSISPASVAVDFCGAECVFHRLGESARFVTHGSRRGIAAIAGDLLYVNLSRESHAPGHPLHLPGDDADVSSRPALLKRIMQARPSGVVEVVDACECGFAVPIIRGAPWIDDGHLPAWHRVTLSPKPAFAHPLSDWRTTCSGLGQLADGLAQLHGQGIAHGDPFLFNAMCDEMGQSRWVDLNDTLPITDERACRDLWAFLHYCCAYAFRLAPGKFDAIAALLIAGLAEDQPTAALRALAARLQVLAGTPAPTSDASGGDDATMRFEGALANFFNHGPTDVARRLSSQGLGHFSAASIWNSERARQADAMLAMERIRHSLLEREIHRTLGSAHEAERQSLTTAKNWFEQQAAAWEKTASAQSQMIASLQANAVELEKGKHWLADQRDKWERECTQREQELIAARALVEVLQTEKAKLDAQCDESARLAREHREQADSLQNRLDLLMKNPVVRLATRLGAR